MDMRSFLRAIHNSYLRKIFTKLYSIEARICVSSSAWKGQRAPL